MSKRNQKLRLCAAHMPLIRHSTTKSGLGNSAVDSPVCEGAEGQAITSEGHGERVPWHDAREGQGR